MTKFCYQCGLQIDHSLEVEGVDFCGEGCYREMIEERNEAICSEEAAYAKRALTIFGMPEEAA